MLKPEEHELLSRTGRGTPMGELLRRYWVPALLTEELPAAGGPPVRVRLLGEDLVAFRSPSGEVGLLAEFCTHRGASLFFGKNEEGGLRCCYHGWKYDVSGRCVEMPNEPAGSNFKDKVAQPAYPCQEAGGIIWAWMGPVADIPPLPELELLLVPDGHRYASKRLQHCHWTQAQDGDVDSSHVSFLHEPALRARSGVESFQASEWILNDRAPTIEVVATSYGFMIGSRRQANPGFSYWRVNHWLMPWFTLIPAFTGDGPLGGHAWVPIDDEHTWAWTFSWHPTRPLTDDELDRMKTATDPNYTRLVPGSYEPRGNRANGYNGDRPLNAEEHPWQRLEGIQEQDIAMTEGMGPRFDRTKEHLASADVAVIQVRRRLLATVDRLQQGLELPGADPASYRVRQVSTVLPEEIVSWPEAIKDAVDASAPETFAASA